MEPSFCRNINPLGLRQSLIQIWDSLSLLSLAPGKRWLFNKLEIWVNLYRSLNCEINIWQIRNLYLKGTYKKEVLCNCKVFVTRFEVLSIMPSCILYLLIFFHISQILQKCKMMIFHLTCFERLWRNNLLKNKECLVIINKYRYFLIRQTQMYDIWIPLDSCALKFLIKNISS